MTRLTGAESRGSLGCHCCWERARLGAAAGHHSSKGKDGAGVSGFGSWSAWCNSGPRNRAEGIWSPTAQGLLWEQTAAELAVGWHSLLEASAALRAEALHWKNMGVFCARVKPWSLLSHLQSRPRDQGTA